MQPLRGVLAVLFVILTGCASLTQPTQAVTPPSQGATQPTQAGDPWVIRERIGGLCPDGECVAKVVVVRDGHFQETANGQVMKQGQLSRDDLLRLQAAVRTTRLSMASSATSMCPRTYDGIEVRITWPAPTGNSSVASCVQAVDAGDPLVATLDALFP